ncbi:SGNH/GDSL hydrolase family protein [Salinimonas sediminis]|uniref:SGNH/GDSL hydrolase family protein n=1 Tax=Salinimonas sediminis TaxID=2303538 RepID=A0A346NQP2_9ALTE|nr:SGNH/GDSL hydrolase family protein [Salinimonas sediminis]AXR07849.1 SGNH/GDSL hydrolase family protein [Salinimonas sediminis]
MNFLFFGASVCEQTTKHDTGEVTGFVNVLQDLCDRYRLDVSINRVTAGSCSIGDAGIALVDDVVKCKPDVCFVEWCTPAPSDSRAVDCEAIYSKLIENDILPVTLVLPRRDRDQRLTQVYSDCKTIADHFKLPFIDLSQKYSLRLLEHLLRDVVHTNSLGANVYAHELFSSILNLKKNSQPVKNYMRPNINFHNIYYDMQKYKNRVKNIYLEFDYDTDHVEQVIVFMEQRIGPWSRRCRTELDFGETTREGSLDMFDAWSWRERQCIKPLTTWFDLDSTSNSVSLRIISEPCVLNGFNSEQARIGNFSNIPHEIRPKGRLIIVSTTKHIKIKNVGVS